MDPELSAAIRGLSAEISGLLSRVQKLEAGARQAGLRYSSIDGGALVVKDAGGTDRAVVGAQADGSYTVTVVNAPPPAVPSTPGLLPLPAALGISWDGQIGGAAPKADFQWCEVHLSPSLVFTPGQATLQGVLHAAGSVVVAGLTPGTAYYCVLSAVSQGGAASVSAQATGTPAALAGGNKATVAAVAPASPSAGDLWWDSANGYRLNQWNGAAWTPYQYGTSAIANGAVTTAQIAAAAGITGAQLSSTAGLLGTQLASNAAITSGQVAFTARNIGGITTTVAASAPGSPAAGDLWFDSAHGYQLNRYTGSAWTPYQYGTSALAAGSVTAAVIAAHTITATEITAGTITAAEIAAHTITANQITAGTITATQIATGTITAGLLAAGIVKGGIVDGTVVSGAQLVAYGVNGNLLIYAGTPAAGNLMLAISPLYGSDGLGNAWDQGVYIKALAGLTNLFSIENPAGDNIVNIDEAGNLSAQVISATDVTVGGTSLAAMLAALPQGIMNRGWTPIGPWPATPIGWSASETALLELDYTVPPGRATKFVVESTTAIVSTAPTGNQQLVFNAHVTTDGSSPTTSSPVMNADKPYIVPVLGSTVANYPTPYMEWIFGAAVAEVPVRVLVAARLTASGAWYLQNRLEARFEDIGADVGQLTNAGVTLGSGSGGGGASKQTYTKTYYATASHSYYGSTASYGSGPDGKRSDNSSCYQGCSSGLINGSGDQYSFAEFNHTQIASDLAGATINWVKVRLNCLHSWYNSGMYVILGTTTFGGTFGDPFIPGAGTTFNRVSYWIGEGATLTKDVTGAGIGTAFQSGGATALCFGRSADRSSSTDLNNYGYFFGAGNTAYCPMIQINYTK